MGNDALVLQIDDKGVQIALKITLVESIDGGKCFLWPAEHRLGGLVQQLQCLRGVGTRLVIADPNDMLAHPLEEGVLPDDLATKAPVHEGILDLMDQLLLFFRHRSHELCSRLGTRRQADIPPHQHERRPAAGHQHALGVEHEDIKIIDGEGTLAAEHCQRPVSLLTIVGHGPDQ
ncbi:hypothetical protein D3C81_1298880 [compost metagenome]